MKALFYIFIVFFLTGCGTVQKLFTKEKTKTEIKETIKSEEVSTIDTHSDSETIVFTETEIKNIFSELDFTFTGTENNDQAEIQLTKTKEGITVKVIGKATTTFNQKEFGTTATETTAVSQSENLHQTEYKHIGQEKQTTIKEKTINQQKEVKRFDFSVFIWIGLILIAALTVYLWHRKRKNSISI